MGINLCFSPLGGTLVGIKPLLFFLWEAPWWVLNTSYSLSGRHPGGYYSRYSFCGRHPGGYYSRYSLCGRHPGGYTPPCLPLWEAPRWVYSSLFSPVGGTLVGIYLLFSPPSCGRHPGGYIPSVPPVGGTLVGIYPSLYTLVGTLLVYMPPCIPRVGSLPPVYMPAMLRTDLVHVNGLLGMTVLTRGLYLRGSSLRKRGKEAKRRFYARM